VFGGRTAAMALPSRIDRLPNGDGFQYAIANYVSASGVTLEGQGVVPDEEVAPERELLVAGRDPILDAAVTWIQRQVVDAANRQSPDPEHGRTP
jgi:carboxyl-terminal processing protease